MYKYIYIIKIRFIDLIKYTVNETQSLSFTFFFLLVNHGLNVRCWRCHRDQSERFLDSPYGTE